MNLLKKRKTRKVARELLSSSRHFRRMREDVTGKNILDEIIVLETGVRNMLRKSEHDDLLKSMEALNDRLGETFPKPRNPGLKENVEVIVIALCVAIGFRTYFLQPFRIPTGSMQPTLYGITHDPLTPGYKAGLTDKTPLRYVKFLLTGKRYVSIQAPASGEVYYESGAPDRNNRISLRVGDKRVKLHKNALQFLNVAPGYQTGSGDYQRGESVEKGQVLAEYFHKTGDQLFVDRVRWNFSPPERGQVMVFLTNDIEELDSAHRGEHYIKRLVGLPGENIQIRQPDLLIDGTRVTGPDAIMRIQNQDQGHNPTERYAGYINTGSNPGTGAATKLATPDSVYQISEHGYFACGDNQRSSHDSRYWGEVPQNHMVGPAVFVYWPFTERWGLIK